MTGIWPLKLAALLIVFTTSPPATLKNPSADSQSITIERHIGSQNAT
jgi:hypothetical protein